MYKKIAKLNVNTNKKHKQNILHTKISIVMNINSINESSKTLKTMNEHHRIYNRQLLVLRLTWLHRERAPDAFEYNDHMIRLT